MHNIMLFYDCNVLLYGAAASTISKSAEQRSSCG